MCRFTKSFDKIHAGYSTACEWLYCTETWPAVFNWNNWKFVILSDKAVHSKLLHKIWNHGELREYFTAAVPTEGVIQVLCMSWIGKYGKTVHCLHYNLATRVYREVINAIVQMQTKNITNNCDSVDGFLKQNPTKLRKKHYELLKAKWIQNVRRTNSKFK